MARQSDARLKDPKRAAARTTLRVQRTGADFVDGKPTRLVEKIRLLQGTAEYFRGNPKDNVKIEVPVMLFYTPELKRFTVEGNYLKKCRCGEECSADARTCPSCGRILDKMFNNVAADKENEIKAGGGTITNSNEQWTHERSNNREIDGDEGRKIDLTRDFMAAAIEFGSRWSIPADLSKVMNQNLMEESEAIKKVLDEVVPLLNKAVQKKSFVEMGSISRNRTSDVATPAADTDAEEMLKEKEKK
jgi:hypothetical protein